MYILKGQNWGPYGSNYNQWGLHVDSGVDFLNEMAK